MSEPLTDEEEGMTDLRRALAINHERLYHTNAHFYNAINLLAEMLPAMVDGLAAQAENEAESRNAMREMLERSTAIPIEPGSYVDQQMRARRDPHRRAP